MKSLAAPRKYLTPKQATDLWAKQGGLCGCGCGEPLSKKERVIKEHKHEFVALGNAEAPDAIYRKPCADKKTYGVRGDIATIWHIKRLATNNTQHDRRKKRGYSLIQGKTKIESAGFRKDVTRGFDGRVRPR